jgi:hypothetical protein
MLTSNQLILQLIIEFSGSVGSLSYSEALALFHASASASRIIFEAEARE